MAETTREVHLAARPVGTPKESDFTVVERPLPEPGAGEMLVRNIYMSVDPYMRARMRGVKTYIDPFEIGKILDGGSVGQVVESRCDGFAAGDFVFGREGWREHYISGGQGQRKLDPSLGPLSAFLGVLGMPGLTAYVGLLEIGKPQPGETVLVSAAAGAVGSVVGQIAKLKGCRVVGSAGSQAKVDYLTNELGFDAAFSYRVGPLGESLQRTCPDGIDVYFENVGGQLLEAVLPRMREFGRIPVCGMISQYNNEEPTPGPTTLVSVITKRLTMQGFLVSDWLHRTGDFLRNVSAWLAQGQLTHRETVVEGIDRAPQALIGLFEGENLGKMIVKLADDPTQGS